MADLKINHSGRAHALLSASGASRWMRCTPSARLEDLYPERESSLPAREGTLAHELAELKLMQSAGLITGMDEDPHSDAVADCRMHDLYAPEMEDHTDAYVDYVMESMSALKDPVLLIEERLDLTEWIPDGFGTGDAGIISADLLHSIDLKYGIGVRVSAEDNPQLKLYGLGFIKRYLSEYPQIQRIKMSIFQPRLDHIDEWEISLQDLMQWAEEEVRDIASKAFAGEGDLSAGDWCQWCSHAPKCTALRDLCLHTAGIDFDDPLPTEVMDAMLTDEEMVDLYKKIPVISKWLSKVEEFMQKESLRGYKWQGLKLVEGRSQRQWRSSPEEVAQTLSDNLYLRSEFMQEKLQSLGALEKLLGKKGFNEILGDHIHKPAGAPTLVPTEDKRPEFGLQSAIDDFNDDL